MRDQGPEVTNEGTTDWSAGADRRRLRTRPQVPDVALAIAFGGALGAIARYGLSTAWPSAPGRFPWATFTINVSGCLLIGTLMAVLTAAGRPHRLVRPFVGVGVLGGFTTFSTYTVEADRLFTGDHPQLALVYLFGTLAAALVAVQIGIFAARVLLRPRNGRGTRR